MLNVVPSPGADETVSDPPAWRDDPVRRREAEAGSLAGLLRREEGLEDPILRRRVHAEAGVGDGDDRGFVELPRASIVRRPPSGIASRALTTTFISTWSICTG